MPEPTTPERLAEIRNNDAFTRHFRGSEWPDGATIAEIDRADLLAVLERHEDLLASVVLYISWRYVTKQLTTEQKELFADAIERSHGREHGPDGEEPDPEMASLPSYAPRWWRPDFEEARRG